MHAFDLPRGVRPWSRAWWVRLLAVLVAQVAALAVLSALTDWVEFDSFLTGLLAVTVIAVIDSVLWPVVVRWTFPLIAFTVGLFSFVLSSAMVVAGAAVVDGFDVSGWWAAFAVGAVLGACTAVAGSLVGFDDDDAWRRSIHRRVVREQDRHPPSGEPGVLFIQIDGLSYDVLRDAVDGGHAPTIASLIDHGYRLVPWECDLSSQTGAMQAGILLGNNENMPAFRWYDKERRRILVSNNPGDAADIEARQSSGRGLLAGGGASRGNVFSGDADDVLFTFSHLRAGNRRNRSAVSIFATPNAVAHIVGLALADIWRELRSARVARREDVQPAGHRGGIYPLLRAAVTVGLAEVTSATLAGDVIRGVPLVYCDYVGYDEVAHHSGIRRPESYDTLRRIDDRLRRLMLGFDDAPRPYEIVVLSDHGQTQGATFLQRYGESLEDVVRRLTGADVVAPETVTEGWGNVNGALTDLANDDESVAARFVRRTLRSHMRDGEVEVGPATHPDLADVDDEVIVLASGNLGLISFAAIDGRATLAEIERRHPDFVASLADHPGIGFVMVRSSDDDAGLVIGADGVHHLATGEIEGVDPLAPFGPNAADHLRRTDRFVNCPDVIVNSFYDPVADEGAAFEELIGFHGGLGGLQTRPFLLAPPSCRVPDEPIVGAERVHDVLQGWVGDIRAGVTDRDPVGSGPTRRP